MSTNQQPIAYLALSGGGWNSHSSLAGIFSGALESMKTHQSQVSNLESLLRQFDGVSGNSGGTWFLSHLAYSEKFAQALLGKLWSTRV